MSKPPIYLDYNATTPIDPSVVDVMLPFLYEHFGNPSSSHAFGAAAKKGVENARRQVANMLGCIPDEIVFTSSGSESNNLAIKGTAYARRKKGNHFITSSVEHPAVLEVCAYLETQGFTVTRVPVDEHGLVNLEDVESSITPGTIMISIMHANNEVGTIQSIQELSNIAHSHNILFHTDAAQSIGKIPVNVQDLGVDLLSVAGHKIYAPKGVGALYIRTGVELQKIIHGAEHEHGLRAGTENVLEIVGLGQACQLVSENLNDYAAYMHIMREKLETDLMEDFPWIRVNGHPSQRLPNTLSVSFPGIEANTILSELTEVAASAGAACHAEHVDVSHVLEAMNVPIEYAMGTIRLSVGRTTSEEEIDRALIAIRRVIGRLRPADALQIKSSQREAVRLTQFTHGLGCACKLRPQLLEEVLKKMPIPSDKRILVGTETADDAAVYQINDTSALVQTVDFFTPIVDDPYQFGAISAANSLSDIYAMGAKPLFALSVVGFPSGRLPISVLEDILKGAYDKAEEAGIAVIGGHTVDDVEPKFGLAVTGMVDPKHVLTNAGSKPGDVLVLTKRLGTGILTTAMKQGMLEESDLMDAISTMSQLNRHAAELMQEIGTNACTDVTGFGLFGHLLGMMRASKTGAEVSIDQVPFFNKAFDLASSGIIPGGTKSNWSYTFPYTDYDKEISRSMQYLLNDAQTSGGLLISMTPKNGQAFVQQMNSHGHFAVLIGKVIELGDKFIRVS